jgi:hypothetical protein
MGEKGNALEAVPQGATASVVERTTTIVGDTAEDVAKAVRDQAIGAVAGGVVGAASERLKRDDDEQDGEGTTDERA